MFCPLKCNYRRNPRNRFSPAKPLYLPLSATITAPYRRYIAIQKHELRNTCTVRQHIGR
nr:MAG TPA: hypothetical protein [Caudoviricetes sp.]